MAIQRMDLDKIEKNSFIMFKTSLEQAYNFYDRALETGKGMDFCAEVCIALMETALAGKTTSDNFYIQQMVLGDAKVAQQNNRKWEDRREARRVSGHYYDVAELARQGMSQADIADELEITSARVSQIVSDIKRENPDLLIPDDGES